MEVFLLLNGFEVDSSVDVQERIILDLAAGQLSREEFALWVTKHTVPTGDPVQQALATVELALAAERQDVGRVWYSLLMRTCV